MRRILTVGMCIAVIAGTATTAITQSAAATGPLLPSATCAQVFFLGARGSGQTWKGVTANDKDYDAGTGFGPQVYEFYTRFTAGLNRSVAADSLGNKYSSRSVNVLVPSVLGALPTIAAVRYYLSGLDGGVNVAYNDLVERAASCPRERVVMAGFSQGAMLVHRLLHKLVLEGRTGILSRVDGAALIADGDRVPNSKASDLLGSPAARPDGHGVATAFGLAPEGDVPRTVQPETVNICTKNDIVCDFGTTPHLLHAKDIHTDTYQISPVLKIVAQRFRNSLRPSVPGPPTHVVGVPSDHRVALSWQAPASTGGSPITRYAIRYSTDGRRTWRAGPSTPNASTSASVTGLTNGVPLFFQVAARNGVGTSAWSSASPRVTPTAPATTTTTTQPNSNAALTAISAGDGDTCAIASGAAKCWGYNGAGQLGDGSRTDSNVPVQVVGLTSGVTAISASAFGLPPGPGTNQFFTCAVVSGAAKCWGGDGAGQLGNGSMPDSNVPVQVVGLTSDVTAISAGYAHACAIVSGAAKCWGNNTHGELGDGSTNWSNVPVQVVGLTSGVTAISTGPEHTCAVASGTAKCWGASLYGELGDGTTGTESDVPVQVVGLTSGVTAISAGMVHTCAIVSNAARCWGSNAGGQLGDGTTTDSNVPVQVVGLTSGAAEISASLGSTCAIVSAAAQCWGAEAYHELGLATTPPAPSVPVQVVGLTSGVTAIGAGRTHACVIASDLAECWGNNGAGQLGDGTTTDSNVPVQVVNLAPD